MVRKVHQRAIDSAPEATASGLRPGVAKSACSPSKALVRMTCALRHSDSCMQHHAPFPRGDRHPERQTEPAGGRLRGNPQTARSDVRWAVLHYATSFPRNHFLVMLGSFGGTIAIVFVMMVILFRSCAGGPVHHPLTLNNRGHLRLTGLVGKITTCRGRLERHQPGIADDFAIPFLNAAGTLRAKAGSLSGPCTMSRRPALASPQRAIGP